MNSTHYFFNILILNLFNMRLKITSREMPKLRSFKFFIKQMDTEKNANV